MGLESFARAIILGFTIAAAVGPISLLTIRRTIAHGRTYGLASGMGVAAADATYAAIAATSLAALTSALVGARVPLGVVGGVVIAWIGLRTARTQATQRSAGGFVERPGLAAGFSSIYLLTMANPMTILSFSGIFAALGIDGREVLQAVLLTAGAFVGSAAWWLVLTAVVDRARGRVTLRVLSWVNRVSGSLLIAFGLLAVATAVRVAVGG